MRLPTCASAVLLTLLVSSHVAAQGSDSLPRAEIKIFVGASDFSTDNESYPHFVVGGATKIRIFRHWSFEPEFNYMRRSSNDEDIVVQPNIVYEFSKKEDRYVPYLIGGVGFIKHKSVYRDTNYLTGVSTVLDTSYQTWSVSAGAGLKIYLSKNLYIAPEARLGREPTVRATVSLGYVFPVRD